MNRARPDPSHLPRESTSLGTKARGGFRGIALAHPQFQSDNPSRPLAPLSLFLSLPISSSLFLSLPLSSCLFLSLPPPLAAQSVDSSSFPRKFATPRADAPGYDAPSGFPPCYVGMILVTRTDEFATPKTHPGPPLSVPTRRIRAVYFWLCVLVVFCIY